MSRAPEGGQGGVGTPTMHLRTTLRFESRETLQALAVHDEPTQTRIFAMPERHRRHRHRLSPRVSYYIHFVLIGIVFNIHFSIMAPDPWAMRGWSNAQARLRRRDPPYYVPERQSEIAPAPFRRTRKPK